MSAQYLKGTLKIELETKIARAYESLMKYITLMAKFQIFAIPTHTHTMFMEINHNAKKHRLQNQGLTALPPRKVIWAN